VGLGAKRVRTVTGRERSARAAPGDCRDPGPLLSSLKGKPPVFRAFFTSPTGAHRSFVKILVDRLSATPQASSFEAGTAWWRAAIPPGRDLPGELEEPFRVDLTAYRVGDDLILDGEIRGSLPLECGRCLARYREAVRESFRVVLEPAGVRVPADPEGAQALARYGMCLADELEAGWYQGNEIDLSGLVREVICLAIPVQPLCREDCAGLCPHCGVDRNVSTCNCPETTSDSPFAVLAALRKGSGGGPN